MAHPQREWQVLDALIWLYIRSREPVSSRMIEESGRVRLKSASIRNVLGELERRGFLSQPHSSSGRVPTDEGYRAFADNLLGGTVPEEALDPREQQLIERALAEAGEDMEQVFRATAQVVGKLSQNIAIFAGPLERSPIVAGVELHARDSRHVFVVISLDNGTVRTELVELDREVVPEGLAAATTWLASRLVGRSLDDNRRELDDLLDTREDHDGVGLGADVARQASNLFHPDRVLQVTFEGLDDALQQPEFGEPERLKALLAVMARGQEFQRALEEFVGRDGTDVSVAIGRENPLPALHPFSLLATRLDWNAQYAYLAILGPRRMEYARTLALIRLITRHLDRLRP